MSAVFIDIHPHIISEDLTRYPRVPLFGKQSDWSRERPVNIDGLVAAMDEAGVAQAAIVQSSTCYGYDNSYVTDAIRQYPGRFTAVSSVDVLQADAPARIEAWVKRGVSGLRLFTGGSTAAFDPSTLDDARSFPAWHCCGELGLSMAIQTDPSGAGTAEWIPALNGPWYGTRYSWMLPVTGSIWPIRPLAHIGIQSLPSLSGTALQGMRLGPGISYST